MKVLLLKAPKDDDAYLMSLADEGHDAKCQQVLSFQYINIDSLSKYLNSADDFDALVLTSQNAIEACKQAAVTADLNKWQHKKNFAVGAATHKQALDHLGLNCLGAEAGSADSLADIILEELKSLDKACILYPKTSLKTVNLTSKLIHAGYQVVEIEVYNTIPYPELQEELYEYTAACGAPDVCVFFSPSGVDFSLQKLKDLLPKLPIVVAVGATTSKALHEAGVPEHLVMKSPKPESLLTCLRDLRLF